MLFPNITVGYSIRKKPVFIALPVFDFLRIFEKIDATAAGIPLRGSRLS